MKTVEKSAFDVSRKKKFAKTEIVAGIFHLNLINQRSLTHPADIIFIGSSFHSSFV